MIISAWMPIYLILNFWGLKHHDFDDAIINTGHGIQRTETGTDSSKPSVNKKDTHLTLDLTG
jgi:hypothetical protein